MKEDTKSNFAATVEEGRLRQVRKLEKDGNTHVGCRQFLKCAGYSSYEIDEIEESQARWLKALSAYSLMLRGLQSVRF